MVDVAPSVTVGFNSTSDNPSGEIDYSPAGFLDQTFKEPTGVSYFGNTLDFGIGSGNDTVAYASAQGVHSSGSFKTEVLHPFQDSENYYAITKTDYDFSNLENVIVTYTYAVIPKNQTISGVSFSGNYNGYSIGQGQGSNILPVLGSLPGTRLIDLAGGSNDAIMHDISSGGNVSITTSGSVPYYLVLQPFDSDAGPVSIKETDPSGMLSITPDANVYNPLTIDNMGTTSIGPILDSGQSASVSEQQIITSLSGKGDLVVLQNVSLEDAASFAGAIVVEDSNLEIHSTTNLTSAATIVFGSSENISGVTKVTSVTLDSPSSFQASLGNLKDGDEIILSNTQDIYATDIHKDTSGHYYLDIFQGEMPTTNYPQPTESIQISGDGISATNNYFSLTKSGNDSILTYQTGNPVNLAAGGSTDNAAGGQGVKVFVFSSSTDEASAMADVVKSIAPAALTYIYTNEDEQPSDKSTKSSDGFGAFNLIGAIQEAQQQGATVFVDDADYTILGNLQDVIEAAKNGIELDQDADGSVVINNLGRKLPITFVTASGNSNQEPVDKHAQDPNEISVGAVNWLQTPFGGLTPFSGEPFTLPASISAPDGGPTKKFSSNIGSNFDPFFGTSAAAPAVAGAVALIQQANSALSPDQIASILYSTAVTSASGTLNSKAGLVDVTAAVAKAKMTTGALSSTPGSTPSQTNPPLPSTGSNTSSSSPNTTSPQTSTNPNPKTTNSQPPASIPDVPAETITPSAPVQPQSGLNPLPSTVSNQNADGSITTTTYQPNGTVEIEFSNLPSMSGRRYSSYSETYASDGTLLNQVRNLNNGSHSVSVNAPGQTLHSDLNDTFYAAHQGSTTFVFQPGEELGVVKGFKVSGTDHDTVSLLGADFHNSIASVLKHTIFTAGGATIFDPVSGDIVRLANVTQQQLTHNKKDITFHS